MMKVSEVTTLRQYRNVCIIIIIMKFLQVGGLRRRNSQLDLVCSISRSTSFSTANLAFTYAVKNQCLWKILLLCTLKNPNNNTTADGSVHSQPQQRFVLMFCGIQHHQLQNREYSLITTESTNLIQNGLQQYNIGDHGSFQEINLKSTHLTCC